MQFLWFCAAGYSFALGCAFLIASVLLVLYRHSRLYAFSGIVCMIIGWASIVLASMSFSLVVTLAVFAALLVWHAGGWYLRKRSTKVFRYYGISNLLILILALVMFQDRIASPALPKEIRNICVVGDSISAGIGGPTEKTWPLVLSQNSGIEVLNLAASGATVNSALHKQIPKAPTDQHLVLLEIGGNDLFGPTPIKEFRRDLDLILTELKSKGHQVAMFELPVLPWQWSYGRTQWELAIQHEVMVIPKRVMVSIFSKEGTTSDLAHLTAKGHKLMAETVQELLTKRQT